MRKSTDDRVGFLVRFAKYDLGHDESLRLQFQMATEIQKLSTNLKYII